MSGSSAGEITVLLRRWNDGDAGVVQDLTPLVYEHLRLVAMSYLRRERGDHTLQATALVNELFVRLIQQERANLESRAHK